MQNHRFSQLVPCDPSRFEAVSDFIASFTRAGMSREHVIDVLTTVIAEPAAVCELWRDDEVFAVALSLDELVTEGNAAELSLFCPPEDTEAIADIVNWATARARAAGRERLDIPEWSGTTLPTDFLESIGFTRGHVMFNMTRPENAEIPQPRTPLRPGWKWSAATSADHHGFYEALCSAWEGLPGAYLSSFDDFSARIGSHPITPLLIKSDDGAVAAFLRVRMLSGDRGELSSLGRHADFRGFGLGEHLVARGIAELHDRGANEIVLEVAADNASGLALYKRFGFAVTTAMNVYRRAV